MMNQMHKMYEKLSRPKTITWLVATNLFFFSQLSFAFKFDCNDPAIKADLKKIIEEQYGPEFNRIKSSKLTDFPSGAEKPLTAVEKNQLGVNKTDAVNTCLDKICSEKTGQTKCRSLPTKPSFTDTWSTKWDKPFDQASISKRLEAEQDCRKDPFKGIGDVQPERLDSIRVKQALSSSVPHLGIDVSQISCARSICKMVKLGWKYVTCGNMTVSQQDVAKLLNSQYLEDKSEVNDGKNLSSCKWAGKLPKRKITGCGACVGYVICEAKSAKGQFETWGNTSKIETMRLATCKQGNCEDAQSCVNDLTIGSVNPSDPGDKRENVIQDSNIINSVRQ